MADDALQQAPEAPIFVRRREQLRNMILEYGLSSPNFHGFALSQLCHIAMDQDYLTVRLTLAIEELTEELRHQRKRR